MLEDTLLLFFEVEQKQPFFGDRDKDLVVIAHAGRTCHYIRRDLNFFGLLVVAEMDELSTLGPYYCSFVEGGPTHKDGVKAKLFRELEGCCGKLRITLVLHFMNLAKLLFWI